MQTFGGVTADDAILSKERRIFVELLFDWAKDGNYGLSLSDMSQFVERISVDRALQGAMPQEIMLIEGSAAAELTVDIAGYYTKASAPGFDMNMASVFSPYNGLSPLYNVTTVGAEVKYRIGVETPTGIIWYDQFIGNVRTVSPNRATGGVTITALDRVEKLRRPLFLTDWAMFDQQANTGYFYGQLLNSAWVIDHCLKTGQTSSTPWRWPDSDQSAAGRVHIYISGNGGSIPNIGWVDGSWQNQFTPDSIPALTMCHDYAEPHPNSPEPTKQPRMFRAMGDGATNWGYDTNLYWARDRDVLQGELGFPGAAIRTHIMAFSLHTQDFAGSGRWAVMPETTVLQWQPRESRTVRVMMGEGKVWIRLTVGANTFNGTQLSIPTPLPNYCRIVAEYDIAGFIRLRIKRTGFSDIVTAIQNVTSLGNPGWSFHELDGLLRVKRGASIGDIIIASHDFSLASVSNPGEAGVAAPYAAVLDKGLNELSFLPSRRGQLAWDVITEVAAAEFGAAFWDESGVFHFWNQDTIQGKKDTPVRTYSIDELQNLSMTMGVDSVRNIALVTSRKARTQKGIVYESKGPDEYIASYYAGFRNVTKLYLDNVVTPSSNRPTLYTHPDQTYEPTYPRWSDLVQHGVVRQVWDTPTQAWKSVGEILPVQTFGLWMYRGPDGETLLRYNNGYTYQVRFAIEKDWTNDPIDPNGDSSSPAFRWEGSKFTQFDDTAFSMSNATSLNKFGPQGLELKGDWYQEVFDYGGLVTKLLARTGEPIPTTDAITVPGDPRLQLGDAITVEDPDGMGSEMKMQVLGITRTFDRDSGLTDTLSVEVVRPPKIGLWDSDQYGLWNQTFYWS